MPRPLVPDRRARILDAAEGMVLAEGFDTMSVAAIARVAGIGKGAVYLEFAAKRDILDALLQRGTARIADAVARTAGPQPSLSALYRATAAALLDDELMTAAFLDDAGVLGAHVATQPTSRYRTRHERVVTGLRDLQRQGRIVPDVEPEALALALSSATLGLLSAARTLGPLDRGTLKSAIDTVGRMAASFETE
ncbi:TetR/AcrR family transcriptional regulator [Microbacterium paraoxydans]|jgi:AcrR family transcriptional regulator|uniref:TetR/AcrR family transcriptional regulator n=1 Tax=Microbacterium TaxID=33882 RepID=UPI000D015DF8|nr:TetR/AcrR family transcriptional regulator [Microbacterium sp. str. 'China']AVL96791.1 TetR/AcrR family transcriptional regulator [Microbacterium sp. str. 'China']